MAKPAAVSLIAVFGNQMYFYHFIIKKRLTGLCLGESKVGGIHFKVSEIIMV